MKKIVSMLMVFVAVMAFSGLTMATPVSAYSYKDVGSKIVYDQSNYDQYIYNWHLVYYNSKHCTFYITKRHKYQSLPDLYGNIYTYKTVTEGIYKVTFKKVNKNHVSVKITTNVYGTTASETIIMKTSLTPYKFFKTKKSNIIKSVMNT